jgi:SAM-dependent methyltransferase
VTSITPTGDRDTMDPGAIRRNQRMRRHPAPTQYNYLHLRRLIEDLSPALRGLGSSGAVILDVFCGSRPYEDLFPPGARVVGLDIDDLYGTADIVTDEFLPGPDAAYDAVTCIEAFHYMRDPPHAVAELRRVLRPGGRALVSLPLVWEYDRETMERRFTGPELEELFADWEEVRVIENGGRSVAWTLLTGTMLRACESTLARRLHRGLVTRAFRPVYIALNALGALMDRIERPRRHPYMTLPPNLMLTARRPA